MHQVCMAAAARDIRLLPWLETGCRSQLHSTVIPLKVVTGRQKAIFCMFCLQVLDIGFVRNQTAVTQF